MLSFEVTTKSAAYYAIPALITAIILLAGYRLFAHSLQAYPGPIAAKLTQFYAGRYVIQQRLHLVIWQNHTKYGSVVRLGPNQLVFNTATALRDIYQNDRVRKSPNYLTTTKNNVRSVFHEVDPDEHRQKRRTVGQAISDRAMRSFEPIMANEVDVFLKQLTEASRSSSPVNMTERSRYLSINISGQLVFGYDLEMQTSETNRFIIPGIRAGNHIGNIFMHLPFLSKISLDSVSNRVYHEARTKFFRLLNTIAQTRVALDKHAKPDFYSYVADQIGAREMTQFKGIFWSEAMILLTAGGDTVATSIPATFFYLARNPQCYKRLAREIRTTFSHSNEIKSGRQLSSCTYLRACIDESLRMSPPVPTTLWRVQDHTDNHPLIVDGHVIPRGTSIGVNTYALHHNESYFPRSFEYQPERWLVSDKHDPDHDSKEAARKRALEAFAPFSVGARSCPGKAMGYLEASLVLAKTIWYFDFEPAKGELGEVGGGRSGAGHGRDRPEEFQLEDMFISGHDGPYLVFRERSDI